MFVCFSVCVTPTAFFVIIIKKIKINNSPVATNWDLSAVIYFRRCRVFFHCFFVLFFCSAKNHKLLQLFSRRSPRKTTPWNSQRQMPFLKKPWTMNYGQAKPGTIGPTLQGGIWKKATKNPAPHCLSHTGFGMQAILPHCLKYCVPDTQWKQS